MEPLTKMMKVEVTQKLFNSIMNRRILFNSNKFFSAMEQEVRVGDVVILVNPNGSYGEEGHVSAVMNTSQGKVLYTVIPFHGNSQYTVDRDSIMSKIETYYSNEIK